MDHAARVRVEALLVRLPPGGQNASTCMTPDETNKTLRFAAASTQLEDAEEAGRILARTVLQQIGTGSINLACLFWSPHYIPHVGELSRAVQAALAPQMLLGCCGEGIIAETEEIEAAPAATLWVAQLPQVELIPLRLSPTLDGVRLSGAEWPDTLSGRSTSPVLLLLADPFTTPMNEVLSMISQRCPPATAIGGLAGGGHDLGQNRLLLNEQTFDEGLVGVALSGQVCVRTIISQGCRPVGQRYVVTKADENVIHELGGKPALTQLQQLFESLGHEDQQLAQRALHLGIVVDEHRNRFERGDFLVRNLLGADRSTGSLAVGEMLQAGQTVQFHVRDAHSASEDLSLLVASDRLRHKQPPLGALIFSCCGRGRGLFGHPHHDVTTVRKEAGPIPIAGFFAQGEIGPVGGSNFLHGYTASVALFSEPTS